MARELKDSLGTTARAKPYIGDPFKAAPDFIASTLVYQDASNEPVLDVDKVDTILLFVDIKIGPATDVRLRGLFFNAEIFTDAQGFQEGREDNATAGQVIRENIEHVFTADFRGFVEITRLSQFCRIQHSATGAPDANTKVAIGVVGQNRVR